MISWSEFQQLDWAHPWWGLLAFQPLLMEILLKLRRNQIMHYADSHLLGWVVRGGLIDVKNNWKKVFNLAAWLFLACAAAGPRLPQLNHNEKPLLQRNALDIMVVLDVSPSMLALDVSPQRLQRAKLELLDLIPRLHGERLGLIAFSGSAGLVMPLSSDYSAFRYYLNLAEPALFETPGTAIGSALELALRKMPVGEKSAQHAVLLLTDAESSALSGSAGKNLWGAADRLREAGVKLYILGMATLAGTTIPSVNGGMITDEGVEVVSRLDQSGFTGLATIANGKFAKVEDGEGDWISLYDNGLLSLPGNKMPLENVQTWTTMYENFLLPALLLLLYVHFPFKLTRPAPLIAVVLIVLVIVPFDANLNVAMADEDDAYAAYRTQNHSRAQILYATLPGYSARMGEGASAYRRKDYQYAIRQFSNALLAAREDIQREHALFNLGNSYFMAEGYRMAADAYLGVLGYTKDNQDARANLALTAGKLAAIRKPGKNSQGIQGRRGIGTGGKLGEDTYDQPLAMEQPDDKKNKQRGATNDLLPGDLANLHLRNNQAESRTEFTEMDGDIFYRTALKKLELTEDKPATLSKALIRIETEREYVPIAEMAPW